MLKDKDVAFRIQDRLQGQFNVEEHRALVLYLYAYYEEGHEPNPSGFIERLPESSLSSLASELAMMSINDELSEQALNDYIQTILIYPQRVAIEKRSRKARSRASKRLFKSCDNSNGNFTVKKNVKINDVAY